MKKLVLLSLAATVITGSAFAASVPVTKISDNSTKIQADYAFNQRVSNSGGKAQHKRAKSSPAKRAPQGPLSKRLTRKIRKLQS